jgi:hypothetical protein
VSFFSILALASGSPWMRRRPLRHAACKAARVTMPTVAWGRSCSAASRRRCRSADGFLGSWLGPAGRGAGPLESRFALLGGIGVKDDWEARSRRLEPVDGSAFGRSGRSSSSPWREYRTVRGRSDPADDAPPRCPSPRTHRRDDGRAERRGLFAGRRFRQIARARLEAFGGLVLLLLGGKILIEHLTAG